MAQLKQGFTVWFTGLPGSGKTTLVQEVATILCRFGYSKVEVFDDHFFPETQKFTWQVSPDEYDRGMEKIGSMANLLTQKGGVVLVSAVSPRREVRQRIRRNHQASFVLVHVDTSLYSLIERDSRGFYSQALSGGVQKLMGRLRAYEKPNAPDLRIQTDEKNLQQETQVLLQGLNEFLDLNLTIPSCERKVPWKHC